MSFRDMVRKHKLKKKVKKRSVPPNSYKHILPWHSNMLREISAEQQIEAYFRVKDIEDDEDENCEIDSYQEYLCDQKSN